MLRSPEEHIKEYAVKKNCFVVHTQHIRTNLRIGIQVRALLGYAQQDAKCFVAVVKLGIGVADGQVQPRDDIQCRCEGFEKSV